MIRFVDNLYLSDKIRSKISVIKWKMACGIGMTGVHFITLSDNGRDLFDIYPAAVFKQKRIRKSDRVIIGVADSYDSAVHIVQEMIDKCMIDCGNLSDVRGYYEGLIKDHL